MMSIERSRPIPIAKKTPIQNNEHAKIIVIILSFVIAAFIIILGMLYIDSDAKIKYSKVQDKDQTNYMTIEAKYKNHFHEINRELIDKISIKTNTPGDMEIYSLKPNSFEEFFDLKNFIIHTIKQIKQLNINELDLGNMTLSDYITLLVKDIQNSTEKLVNERNNEELLVNKLILAIKIYREQKTNLPIKYKIFTKNIETLLELLDSPMLVTINHQTPLSFLTKETEFNEPIIIDNFLDMDNFHLLPLDSKVMNHLINDPNYNRRYIFRRFVHRYCVKKRIKCNELMNLIKHQNIANMFRMLDAFCNKYHILFFENNYTISMGLHLQPGLYKIYNDNLNTIIDLIISLGAEDNQVEHFILLHSSFRSMVRAVYKFIFKKRLNEKILNQEITMYNELITEFKKNMNNKEQEMRNADSRIYIDSNLVNIDQKMDKLNKILNSENFSNALIKDFDNCKKNYEKFKITNTRPEDTKQHKNDILRLLNEQEELVLNKNRHEVLKYENHKYNESIKQNNKNIDQMNKNIQNIKGEITKCTKEIYEIYQVFEQIPDITQLTCKQISILSNNIRAPQQSITKKLTTIYLLSKEANKILGEDKTINEVITKQIKNIIDLILEFDNGKITKGELIENFRVILDRTQGHNLLRETIDNTDEYVIIKELQKENNKSINIIDIIISVLNIRINMYKNSMCIPGEENSNKIPNNAKNNHNAIPKNMGNNRNEIPRNMENNNKTTEIPEKIGLIYADLEDINNIEIQIKALQEKIRRDEVPKGINDTEIGELNLKIKTSTEIILRIEKLVSKNNLAGIIYDFISLQNKLNDQLNGNNNKTKLSAVPKAYDLSDKILNSILTNSETIFNKKNNLHNYNLINIEKVDKKEFLTTLMNSCTGPNPPQIHIRLFNKLVLDNILNIISIIPEDKVLTEFQKMLYIIHKNIPKSNNDELVNKSYKAINKAIKQIITTNQNKANAVETEHKIKEESIVAPKNEEEVRGEQAPVVNEAEVGGSMVNEIQEQAHRAPIENEMQREVPGANGVEGEGLGEQDSVVNEHIENEIQGEFAIENGAIENEIQEQVLVINENHEEFIYVTESEFLGVSQNEEEEFSDADSSNESFHTINDPNDIEEEFSDVLEDSRFEKEVKEEFIDAREFIDEPEVEERYNINYNDIIKFIADLRNEENVAKNILGDSENTMHSIVLEYIQNPSNKTWDLKKLNPIILELLKELGPTKVVLGAKAVEMGTKAYSYISDSFNDVWKYFTKRSPDPQVPQS